MIQQTQALLDLKRFGSCPISSEGGDPDVGRIMIRTRRTQPLPQCRVRIHYKDLVFISTKYTRVLSQGQARAAQLCLEEVGPLACNSIPGVSVTRPSLHVLPVVVQLALSCVVRCLDDSARPRKQHLAI